MWHHRRQLSKYPLKPGTDMADTFDTVKKWLHSVRCGEGSPTAPDERSLVSRCCGCGCADACQAHCRLEHALAALQQLPPRSGPVGKPTPLPALAWSACTAEAQEEAAVQRF